MPQIVFRCPFVTLPFCLVLIAVSVEDLRLRLSKRFSPALITAVILLALGNVLFLSGAARLINAGDQHSGAAWEFSLAQRREVLNSIVEDAGPAPVQIVGPYSGWYPAYEYVLQFSGNPSTAGSDGRNARIAYWIDEVPVPEGMATIAWKRQKEREVNPSVSANLGTSPDWTIDRHWSVKTTQIYRLRFDEKLPLR